MTAAVLPYGAKALVPAGAGAVPADLDLRPAAEPGVTVVTSPSASLLTESLTTALTGAGRRPVWLRLGPEDRDPAELLTSLVVAARRREPGAGRATLELMRARPGPVHGWPDLFDRFADELGVLLADRGALVLEHVHHLPAAGTGLALLGRRVFSALTGAGVSCVLLTHQELSPAALPPGVVRSIGRELRPPPPVAQAALRAAREALGPDAGQGWPAGGCVDDLLTRVARGLLSTAAVAELRRLGLATELEYADLSAGRLPDGPWWQPLEQGWARIRTAWRRPLQDVLGSRHLPGHDELCRVAEALAAAGNLERAVPLLLDLHEEEQAARLLSGAAERLMDLGQWETLDRWVGRLPAAVLAGYPELIHDQGEIAAARGEVPAAHRWFDLASSRFTARADHRGACRSMLAASALAAATGDLPTAGARAAAARALAEATGEPAYGMWATWQQASVTLAGGEPDAALVAFTQAASGTATSEPVGLAGRLSRKLLGVRRERERHRRAQAALEAVERETLARLHASATEPPAVDPAEGWSATPVPLRVRHLGGAPAVAAAPEPGTVRAEASPPGPVLVAQLLGPLQVALDDTPVQDLMGSRVRSLLAYLVTHRRPWPSREVLAEALWPDAPPEAARNSLHVAVHGLRRALRAASEAPVVIRTGAAYRLAPQLRVWLDTDDFEDRIRRARERERVGDREAAVAGYEHAVGRYRGDFLADLPYEDWPALLRERLRVAYLETLDRLGALHFGAHRYARSGELCRRLLELDPCREDAHRRLMRCHSREGQPHLALLQFRACVRTLAQELQVEPGPETVELYRRIRRHDPV
ncbi:BTAD domain-containing putative transcriptional regulator [Actinoplanes sp. NPDC049316]|uniref:BTAD domain-containing putative transcriptional regulator n=1 Tax=Actinoplanes sp. NPDC049316 TaxID=3154727 RepID=UPI00343EC86A